MSARTERIFARRIVFGPLADAFDALALSGPVLAVGTPRSLALLDGVPVTSGVVERMAVVEPHNPQRVVDLVRARAGALAPAAIVAIGSSSAIDLGKAVRFEREALLVTVPTALGGAEMTRGFGIVQAGGVKAGGALAVPSDVVVYDAALLETLGARELGSIGLNGWAHTIEAAYARNARPLGVAAAVAAGRAFAQWLPRAAQRRDPETHRALFEAAYLAGYALDTCGLAFHHAVCHVIGGWSGVPHGIVNAIVLPHALRANAELAPEAMRAVATALGVDDLAAHAETIATAYGLPRTLAELGVDPHVLILAAPRIAKAAALRNNPAPVPRPIVQRVVRLAYDGTGAATRRR